MLTLEYVRKKGSKILKLPMFEIVQMSNDKSIGYHHKELKCQKLRNFTT